MEGEMAIRKRSSWIGLALLGLLAALMLTTSSERSVAAGTPTGQEISAYENSPSATFLGEVQKMKCKLKQHANGKTFHAGGKTTNGDYGLNITILRFKGFSKHYTVPFGVLSPDVSFEGIANDRSYSNVFPFPGGTPPPGGAGEIAFSGGGKRVGLGIYSLPTRDYSQGVALAGGAKCIYPKS
jgi:hypothetical protein